MRENIYWSLRAERSWEHHDVVKAVDLNSIIDCVLNLCCLLYLLLTILAYHPEWPQCLRLQNRTAMTGPSNAIHTTHVFSCGTHCDTTHVFSCGTHRWCPWVVSTTWGWMYRTLRINAGNTISNAYLFDIHSEKKEVIHIICSHFSQIIYNKQTNIICQQNYQKIQSSIN